MWLMVHQITKTIVCLLDIISLVTFSEKFSTEEGELIITEHETRIHSFHDHLPLV